MIQSDEIIWRENRPQRFGTWWFCRIPGQGFGMALKALAPAPAADDEEEEEETTPAQH